MLMVPGMVCARSSLVYSGPMSALTYNAALHHPQLALTNIAM